MLPAIYVASMAFVIAATAPPSTAPNIEEPRSCPAEVSLSWLGRNPYCEINHNRPWNLRGFIIYEFEHMLHFCCGNNTVITYHNETYSNETILKHRTDFILPVARTELQLQAFQKVGHQRFIPVLSDSGKERPMRQMSASRTCREPL